MLTRPEIDGLRAIGGSRRAAVLRGLFGCFRGYAGVDVFASSSSATDHPYYSHRERCRPILLRRVVRHRNDGSFPGAAGHGCVTTWSARLLLHAAHMRSWRSGDLLRPGPLSHIYFWTIGLLGHRIDLQAARLPVCPLSVENSFMWSGKPLWLRRVPRPKTGMRRVVLLTIVGLNSLLFAGFSSWDHPRATFSEPWAPSNSPSAPP